MNKKTKLTENEVEILQLVADGFTISEIARLLSLTENSVSDSCLRMQQKTGAKNMSELVIIALKAGYLNEFPAQLKKHYSVWAGPATPQNWIQRVFNNNMAVIAKLFSTNDLMKITAIFLGTCFMLLNARVVMGSSAMASGGIYLSAYELKSGMRNLLEEHFALTKDVILCVIAEHTGIDSVVHKVVDNQLATSALIKRYYGEEAGKKFAGLLYRNITLATDVMIAYRKGHYGAYNKADMKWRESADGIVAFLTQASPSYKMFGIRKLLDDEMKYTVDEMRAVRNNDNAGSEEAYVKGQAIVSAIADMLTETIVGHFPERFQQIQMSPASYGVK